MTDEDEVGLGRRDAGSGLPRKSQAGAGERRRPPASTRPRRAGSRRLGACDHGSSQMSTRSLDVPERASRPERRPRRRAPRRSPGRWTAAWRSTASPRRRRRRAATSRGPSRRTSPAGRRPRPGSTGPRCLGVGQLERPDPERGHTQQLTLLDQVRGEEDGQGDLGELTGLEVDRDRMLTQIRAPLISRPITGSNGISSRAMPPIMNV